MVRTVEPTIARLTPRTFGRTHRTLARFAPRTPAMFIVDFKRAEIRTSGANIITVYGGDGPPLLLLHGYRIGELLQCEGVMVRRAMVRPKVRRCDGAV